MGMFDWVDYETTCPVCWSKLEGFQTTSGDNLLETIPPQGLSNFYTDCSQCGHWIEYINVGANYIRIIEDQAGKEIELHTKLVKI